MDDVEGSKSKAKQNKNELRNSKDNKTKHEA
jgi:hypothetical protein